MCDSSYNCCSLEHQTFKVPISEGATSTSFGIDLINSDIIKCNNTYNLTVSTSESWCGATTNIDNVSQIIAANHIGKTRENML